MTDMVAQGAKQIANPEEMRTAWGAPNVTQRDIIIPSIIVQQPTSPLVADGKAAFGEFRESLNNELLGKFEDGFNVIPFFMVKIFVERKDNKERDYIGAIPITPQNESLPYNDEIDVTDRKTGEITREKICRDRVMRFYVLLEKELRAGAAIPYTLSMKRTSFQAGQKLATQMYIKNLNSGKTPASVMMKITALRKQKDTLNWAAMDAIAAGPTPDEFVKEAWKWLEIVNSGKAKEHNTEEAEVTKTGEIKDEIPF